MNKILVEVYVPRLEAKYEIFIPVNKKIDRIKEILAVMVNELSGGYFDANNDYLLYDKQTGQAFNHDAVVKDTGIKNGTKIVLI